MKTNAKPFRLITDAECHLIQSAFELKLNHWNSEQALFPLTCTVQRSTPLEHDTVAWIADETGLKLLMVEDGYATLQHALFGEASDCFNDVMKPLLLTLFTYLLDCKCSHVIPSVARDDGQTLDDWFYSGSPALTLTLSQGMHHMRLYLHPNWVLNALPTCPPSPNTLTALDDALETVSIDLSVELNAMPLKLKDMMGLQVGDVIQTEHPITTPVILNHHQHNVCSAFIGETHDYKSIQITRAS